MKKYISLANPEKTRMFADHLKEEMLLKHGWMPEPTAIPLPDELKDKEPALPKTPKRPIKQAN
jgi:hypothetical protein